MANCYAAFIYVADRLGTGPDERKSFFFIPLSFASGLAPVLRFWLTAPLVKLIFSFLLSYPLAGLLKRVPDARPERKNLFIIA